MSAQPRQYYLIGKDTMFLAVVVVTYLTQALEGPLRWGLNMVGAGALLYLRDLAAVICIGAVCASWLAGGRRAFPLVAAVCLLLFHTAIGVFQLGSAFQGLFGFKIFFLFLLGFSAGPLLRTRVEGSLRLASVMFWCTAIGVIVNASVTYPWIGLSYETALGSAQGAKEWSTGGVARLPGLARSSIAAASILTIAFIPLATRKQSPLKRLVTLGAFGYSMYLTTTKGAWTGVAVFLVDAVLTSGLGLTVLANAAHLSLVLLCLVLPIVAVQFHIVGSKVPFVLLSFQERMEDMWPAAFDLLDGPAELFWGRGLGGIGTALTVTERWEELNAADNFFVYVIVSCGALGVFYVFALIYQLMRSFPPHSETDQLTRWMRGWMALFFGYGLTNNMVEESNFNIVFGLMAGWAFSYRPPPALLPTTQRRPAPSASPFDAPNPFSGRESP